jgi:hypothetical protein
LDNAGIKSHCKDIRFVSARTRRRDYAIPIDRLEFSKMPQMTREEYRAMREGINADYGVHAPAMPETGQDTFDR